MRGGGDEGVELAGGTGSRLFPLTKITNKHLLPVYDKPMIYYPIQTLVDAGIRDILIVTGGSNAGDFLRLLGNGKSSACRTSNYTYQEGEGGIAEALALAEHFADGEQDLRDPRRQHHRGHHPRGGGRVSASSREGARILLKKVPDAERFGVAEIARRPDRPHRGEAEASEANYAVTGIYLYDQKVFDKIRELVPSGRGELEITDVNNAYIQEGTMSFSLLEGWWTDAGTFESLLRAETLSRRAARKQPRSPRPESCGNERSGAGSGKARRGLPRPSPSIVLPECEKGIGSVIQAADSHLIEGVRIRPYALWPDDRGYFLEVARMGQGLCAGFSAATTQVRPR